MPPGTPSGPRLTAGSPQTSNLFSDGPISKEPRVSAGAGFAGRELFLLWRVVVSWSPLFFVAGRTRHQGSFVQAGSTRWGPRAWTRILTSVAAPPR